MRTGTAVRLGVAVVIACGSLLGSDATAQPGPDDPPPPLVTDRPTFGASASLVPLEHWQIETGITIFSERNTTIGIGGGEGDLTRVESFVSSFRIGLKPWLELQLNYGGEIDESFDFDADQVGSGTIKANGSADLDLGAKIPLTDALPGGTSATLVTGLTFPTGDTGFGTEGYDPRAVIAVSGALTDRFGFDINFGVDTFTARGSTGDERLYDGILTAALGASLTKHWSAAVEGAAFFDVEGERDPSSAVLGAVAVQPVPRVQFDVFLGFGLTDNSFDTFGGLGVAIRVPD